MRKNIAYFLAFIMLASTLCACQGSNTTNPIATTAASDVTNTTDNAQDSNKKPSTPNPGVSMEIPEREDFATSPESFISATETVIDKAKYSEFKQDGTVYYTLKSEHKTSYNLDYTVKFSSNSAITLPITFAQLQNTDWTTTISADTAIPSTVQKGITYTTPNGKEITLWTTGLTSLNADGNNNAPLSDCKFYTLQINICNELRDKDESGNLVVSFERNKQAPAFTIFDTINEDSSIKDIIDTIGTPSSFEYTNYHGYNEIRIIYKQEENGNYSNLVFSFVGDGNHLISVSYKYALF